MQKRLVNPSYSYNGNDILTYSATCEFLAADGTTVVATLPVSTTRNQNSPAWVNEMKQEIKAQVQAYEDQFGVVFMRCIAEFPTAQTPSDVVAQLTSAIETEVNN
jgi:hypothetical protein